MKIIITKKHEYLSGWTSYDMTWKTDFSGVRNKTLKTVIVVSKEPFSTKSIQDLASENGVDVAALFTYVEDCENDCKEVNKLIKAYNEKYHKNLIELNSDNKCHTHYSATINRNYKPVQTAFETFDAYDVKVRIEYKSGVLEMMFPSVGRQKDAACTRVVLSGKHLKAVYGEEEAIENIKGYIDRYIRDCDTDEKFNALSKKLVEVKRSLTKR